MMLINSLLLPATDTYWDKFTSEVKRLSVPASLSSKMEAMVTNVTEARESRKG